MARVPAKWVRNPSDTLAIEQGCTFDEEAGRFACEFIETFCRQSKGRWAGQPLTLLDWQRDFLMRLFGWKRPDGTRRFRRAYLEVAKKNGKSTLVSGIALFLLLADGEGAPEVYINACDREQASIIYDEASRMVRASPELSRRLDVVDSKKRIVDPVGHGKVVANSADVPNKDGVNSHGALFDELHRQKTRALWDIFEYAGSSRVQPLTLSITTAGEDEDGVWHEQRDYSEKVNAGVIPDTAHLGVVYRALESDDLDDPATWRKANPSLGATIKEEDFARELAEAKLVPVKLNNFKRLRLNIIARESAYFVSAEEWARCGPETPAGPRPTDLERFRGRPCCTGGDLSSKVDLTALVAVFGDDAGGFDVAAWFYLPEETIVEAEHRDGVPYRLWADQGWLTLTAGNVVDYGHFRREVNALHASQDHRKLGIDPWAAAMLTQQLQEEDGVPVFEVRQGYASLSEPTKELQALVRSGRIRHDGNPLLRWCMLNAVVEQDPAGNIKLSKRQSRKKIDGAAATVNALAVAIGDREEASVYETRGIITL